MHANTSSLHSANSGFNVVGSGGLSSSGFANVKPQIIGGGQLQSQQQVTPQHMPSSVIQGRPALRGGISSANNSEQYPMLKTMYDHQKQQQNQAAALLAAQQGLQALLSPPAGVAAAVASSSSSSLSSSNANNSSNNSSSNNNNNNINSSSGSSNNINNSSSNGSSHHQHHHPNNNNNNNTSTMNKNQSSYPHAMDCDPPSIQHNPHHHHQPPHQSLINNNGGSSGNGSIQSRLRHNYGTHNYVAQAPVGHSLQLGQLPQHHSYAPASLPIDLMHHPLSAAASHLMMTDPSVITASAANSSTLGTAPPAAYNSMFYHQLPHAPNTQNAYMLPKTNTAGPMHSIAYEMPPPSALLHHHHHQQQQQQQQHTPSRGESSVIRKHMLGNSSGGGARGDSLDSVDGLRGNPVVSGDGSGTGADDTSSPMVGVCVQPSPVVIH